MRIVFVLKPYAVEVYLKEDAVYTPMNTEYLSSIEGESSQDYEKRMVFVCKQFATNIQESAPYKKIASRVTGVDVVLAAPWCRYDVVHIDKDFGKKTKITEQLITSLQLKKDEDSIFLVESFVSSVFLNGYTVETVSGQYAQTVECQFVHIYAQKTFIQQLTKSVESIFHTHDVRITSLYSLVDTLSKDVTKNTSSKIQIILEEESIDIAYTHHGVHVMHMFIPYGFDRIEQKLAVTLSTDVDNVRQILISRGEYIQDPNFVSVNKNAKKLWPDLDVSVKQLVEQTLEAYMLDILTQVKNYVDAIDKQYITGDTSLYVYGVNPASVYAYGTELTKKISEDPYITLKMPMKIEENSITSIF